MRTIYTIGYEGVSPDDLISALEAEGVALLLDVRELPLSRRRGFSKNALRLALEARGIGYRHERALGAPAPIRHRVKRDGDWQRYFRAYDRHLDGCSSLIESIAATVTGSVALLCFEADPETCHRRSVARALAAESGRPVRHLLAEGSGAWSYVAEQELAAA